MTATQTPETTATVTPITEAPKTAARRPSRATRGAAKATPKATGKAAPKATAPKAAPIVVSAPKGGTQTVSPKRGAVAKAIKASGLSIQAIARQHHQNPSQLRRLAADSVAKVDLVRAQSIAKALGVKVDTLFGAAETKATAAAKAAPKPATRKAAPTAGAQEPAAPAAG
jgi:ribosome-binding protein aMBF1 (putative translation factor)